MKKSLVYIADFSLPNMSAYALHVLKMCDAFSELNYSVNYFYLIKKKHTIMILLEKSFYLKKNLR